MGSRILVAVGIMLIAIAPARAMDARAWPGTFLGRLQTFALIEELNGELLASSSATATLGHWCAEHHMSAPARMTAIAVRGAPRLVSTSDRAMLQVAAAEPLRYRHVLIACGIHVLSDAENWYVPSRLTADMNHLLDTTRAPFGAVIAPLEPTRRTLSVERLWSPLAPGWEMAGTNSLTPAAGKLVIPRFLFRHRALVLDRLNRPIALVVETYTKGVLDFVH
jgi:hypothetical protein